MRTYLRRGPVLALMSAAAFSSAALASGLMYDLSVSNNTSPLILISESSLAVTRTRPGSGVMMSKPLSTQRTGLGFFMTPRHLAFSVIGSGLSSSLSSSVYRAHIQGLAFSLENAWPAPVMLLASAGFVEP